VDAGALGSAMAKDLWLFLSRGLNPHAKALEVRQGSHGEDTIVFEVDVEVSQVRVHDIRPRERVSATFVKDHLPEVLALRADFPHVPHINPRDEEFPRSLCLYDESFDELSLRWTAAEFVERVRWWLAETASGTLHRHDQPLEPILLDGFPPLILPADLLPRLQHGAKQLTVIARSDLKVFWATWEAVSPNGPRFFAVVIECLPHVHGVIRRRPRSISDVADVLGETGIDFIEMLRDRVSQMDRTPVSLNGHLILITILPKQRRTGEPIEALEFWAFLIEKPISELGEALGLWQMQSGVAGHLLGGRPDPLALAAMNVDVLNPRFELSRAGAAVMNGVEPSEIKVTAIGMGALGSQVANNLVRAGFGVWTPIDQDFLLPHNVARHEMSAKEAGMPKVEGMRFRLNSILHEQAVASAIEANILHPADKSFEVRTALDEAEVILDFSASLAVGRYLARDPSPGRRCSVFLNPRGSDLVILCEDIKRLSRLDWLEFQYYRALINEPGLIDHLSPDSGRIRYARSCRDLTSRVPQHLVALHSGIAAGTLQRVLRGEKAFIGIWHADDNMGVRSFAVKPSLLEEFSANGWTLATDETFLNRIAKLRGKKSKKETGGVLIGSFDQKTKTIYLVDTICSPPDSEEWPTLYIRGCEGLKANVDEIVGRSDGQIGYVGEWHSHPDGYTTEPSEDDRTVFRWLDDHMVRDGRPPVMLIAGEKDFRFFLGSMDASVVLKRTDARTPESAHQIN